MRWPPPSRRNVAIADDGEQQRQAGNSSKVQLRTRERVPEVVVRRSDLTTS
jgi:hypothetical protein